VDGPYWNQFSAQPDFADCEATWWRVLTFTNNFGMPDTDTSCGCMSWTWCVNSRLHFFATLFSVLLFFFFLSLLCGV
jgi:hypothetical protein